MYIRFIIWYKFCKFCVTLFYKTFIHIKFHKMQRILSISLVFGIFFLVSGCFNDDLQPDIAGTLKGTVTIGPLCPVEPCDLSPSEISAAYAARHILVYEDADTSKLLVRIGLQVDGLFKVNLNSGVYLVDMEKNGIDRSADVPVEVTIEPGKTVILDIDIDTGIR